MEQTAAPTDSASKKLEWAFALLMLAFAGYCVASAVRYARYPVQYDYEEGNLLNGGLRITQGMTPYPDPHGWPIIMNPYGPLPYLAVAELVKIFGVSLTPPRMLGIACAIGIAALLALLLRKAAPSWVLSVAFAAMFLGTPLARFWLPIWRVDWLGLFLSLAGLAVFAWKPRHWIAATVLLAGGLFVKYTFLAAPATCGMLLLIRKDWRLLTRYGLSGAALCMAGLVVTQRWSGGHFAFAEFGTHADAYKLSRFWLLLRLQAEDLPLLFALAAIAVYLAIRKSEASLPVVYVLMALVGSCTAGKLGSSSNHLLELTAAVCVAAGAAWSPVVKFVSERFGKRSGFLPGALWAGVCASVVVPGAIYRPPVESAGACVNLQTFLRSHGDAVLTDNLGEALLAGKPAAVSNPFVYTQLVARAGWSDEAVVERVEAKKFDVILLEDFVENYGAGNRFSSAVLEAIRKNYRRAAEFECPHAGVAYVPNP